MILDLHKLLHNRQTWAGRGSSRPRALEEDPRTTLLRHLISLLCQSAETFLQTVRVHRGKVPGLRVPSSCVDSGFLRFSGVS